MAKSKALDENCERVKSQKRSSHIKTTPTSRVLMRTSLRINQPTQKTLGAGIDVFPFISG